MRTLIAALVSLLLIAPLHASGSKPEAGVSFHLETDPGGNPKMIFDQLVAGQQRFFSRTPEITTRDVTAFSPFPSEDPNSYGLVLKLNNRGSNRLSALSAANQGRWLLTMVNGRVVDGVLIDRQVEDGMLVIWKAVTLPDIKDLDKILPRFGQEKSKQRKRSE